MRLALTLVAVFVATTAAYAPQPAAAAPFTVSGTVTANGAPLSDVVVYAYQGGAGAVCCTPVSGAVSAANGTYSISLEPGSYRVRFYPNEGAYVEQWYDDAADFASGTDVVVGSTNVPGIDASLASGSTISGTVTNDEGTPLEGVGVHAMDAEKECCVWVTGTQTNEDGEYTLTVPDGTYRLYVYSSGAELSEWFDDAPSFKQATDLVIPGAVQVANVVLAGGAQAISGTVTDAEGEPLEDVFVHAFDATAGCCQWVTGAETNDDGEFSLAVPDGQYVLLFYPMSGVMQWWDNATQFDGATAIVVGGGSVAPAISAQLGSGQTLSGTVSAGGTSLENVFVGAFDANDVCCTWIAGGATDAEGEFRFDVPDGTYRLLFYPWDGAYMAEWWEDADSFELAVDVTVAGDEVEDLDADLSTGTAIRGTVTGGGEPLENVYVGAYNALAGVCCEYLAGAGTNEDGEYVLSVPAGDYKLMFYPWDGEFTAEWWNDAADFESATTVPVGTSDVTLGAADLSAGFLITGQVTDGSGEPIEGAYAMAFRVNGADLLWAGGAVTDEDGVYSIVVAPGDYKVQFFGPDGFLSAWYENASDESSATTVTVGEDGTGGDLNDAALGAGQTISGTVTDEGTGDPLPGSTVLVFRTVGSCGDTFVGAGFTNGGGKYSVTVGAGNHYLSFSYGGYATEWWDGAGSCAGASAVTGGTEGVDAALGATADAISGTVLDADTFDPIPGVTVTAYDGLNGNPAGQDTSDANGEYSISVVSGEYIVGFAKTGYVTDFYGGGFGGFPCAQTAADALDNCSVLSVPGGGGTDIDLGSDAVSGTVTDTDTTDPIVGVTVTVTVYDANDGSMVDSVTTTDGTYAVSTGGLGGDFVVGFVADGYVTDFYGGGGGFLPCAQTAADALNNCSVLSVPGGGGTDIDLGSDAISGTVTDTDTTDPITVTVTVTVYDGNDGSFVNSVTTTDGTYSVSTDGLGGDFVVGFAADGYVTDFYGGGGGFPCAQTVADALNFCSVVSVPGGGGTDIDLGSAP